MKTYQSIIGERINHAEHNIIFSILTNQENGYIYLSTYLSKLNNKMKKHFNWFPTHFCDQFYEETKKDNILQADLIEIARVSFLKK